MTSPPTPPLSKRTVAVLAIAAGFACAGGLALPRVLPLSPPRSTNAADGLSDPAPPGPSVSAAASPRGWAVVILVGLAGVALAAWARRPRPAPVGGGAVEFYASLAVDAQCTVSLVRAGSRRLLLGHDAAGVKAMLELPEGLGESEARAIGPVRVTVAPAGRGRLTEAVR